MQKSAIREIAKKAINLDMGARGLRTIMEEVMLDIMYKTPSENDLAKIVVDSECIINNATPKFVYKPKQKAVNAQ